MKSWKSLTYSYTLSPRWTRLLHVPMLSSTWVVSSTQKPSKLFILLVHCYRSLRGDHTRSENSLCASPPFSPPPTSFLLLCSPAPSSSLYVSWSTWSFTLLACLFTAIFPERCISPFLAEESLMASTGYCRVSTPLTWFARLFLWILKIFFK